MVETTAPAVSSGFGAEVGLVESRKAFIGSKNGLGALVPGMSKMVVIFEVVKVGAVQRRSMVVSSSLKVACTIDLY